MSRIKKQILTKLKEYAGKMGKDHLGGDDYTSKKRGGLRDFDGYDNVDYNQDMPMDESINEAKYYITRNLGRGQGKALVKHYDRKKKETGKPKEFKSYKDAQKFIDTIKRGGSMGGQMTAYFVTDKKMNRLNEAKVETERYFGKKGIIIMIRDGNKMISAIFKDKKNADKFNRNNPADVKKLLQLAKKTKYPKAIDESINEVGVNVWYIYKKANKNKNKFFNMLSDFRKKHSDTAWIKMLNYALEDFNENPKKYKTIDDKQNILFKNLQNKKKVYEGMFSTIDQIRQDSKNVRDFVKNVFKDREFKKMSNDKDFIKYLKSIYEGVNEDGHPQNWMSGRTSDYHTALRGKNKDYSGGTNFKKKNHGQPDVEEDDEDQETNHLSNKQLHVKAKLKVAESGKKKSDKNYKDWKSTNEGFDKIEHLSLLNKALRAIPGSPKQKDIIRKLNKVRKAGGMKPLKEQSIVEYASRLTLSYIADKDSKLDGTPEDIKAIDEKAERDYKDEYKKFQSSKKSKKYRAELNKYNRQKGTYGNGDGKDASHKGGKIVGFEAQSKNRGRREKSRLKKESVVNEVGQFPVTNYIKGIIPQGRLDTNTPQNKKKSLKLVKDLKNTLNNFWKSHDIPYRIR